MLIEPSRRSDLVSYPIRDIVQEAKLLERSGKSMIYLNIGDPGPFGFRPPQHILDAVSEALKQNYSGYAPSEGDPELRAAIAEYEKVDPCDVFIVNGLSEGIDFLFNALVDPGNHIILPSPTYPLYITKQRLMFGSENFYNADNKWEPDLESLRKQINKFTKAIVVINPNNPTGAVYSRKTLQGIVDIAGEFKLPIIADDAYEMLAFDGEYTNLRDIHKDVPLVSGNSLSKNYIYPGARVGYLAFHGDGWGKIKDSIQRLCNQRLSVNWEMQRGAIAAIKGPKNHIAKFNEELRKRRDILVKGINSIDGLRVVPPKGAFYAFIELTDGKRWKSDWDFVRALLRSTGVVVVPGSGFSTHLSNHHFRIVFLPTAEQLVEAINRIEMFMKHL
jgi:aspartate/methionine/tyrosine aminotransferase